jgi:DNA polymerase III sliding clamp (beta) subunit (PCNA family)
MDLGQHSHLPINTDWQNIQVLWQATVSKKKNSLLYLHNQLKKNDKSLTFTGKKYTLTVDLLKNKSPINYKIPNTFNLEIEVEKDMLLISALSEESPFIDDDKTKTSLVKIKTNYDYITNEEFFSYFEVFVNDKFLRDAIEPISSDIISLKFINEYSPIVITSVDDNNKNYLAVVMPMSPVFDANKQLTLNVKRET